MKKLLLSLLALTFVLAPVSVSAQEPPDRPDDAQRFERGDRPDGPRRRLHRGDHRNERRVERMKRRRNRRKMRRQRRHERRDDRRQLRRERSKKNGQDFSRGERRFDD